LFLSFYLGHNIFVEGKKVIAGQADKYQSEPRDITLEKGEDGVAEKTDEQEEVEKGKYVITHEFVPCPLDRIAGLGSPNQE
jgi:hypothetical protein